MAAPATNGGPDTGAILSEILTTLKKMQQDHTQLAANMEAIQTRVDMPSSFSQLRSQQRPSSLGRDSPSLDPVQVSKAANGLSSSPPTISHLDSALKTPSTPPTPKRSSITSRIILTTYPGQSGIDPIPLEWGEPDPAKRGPVVVSRRHN